MSDIYERTKLLIGKEGLEKLQNSKVLLFGVGGVGGYVAEGLVRAGIGHICLVDMDVVSTSNINRQVIALHSTVGMPKVTVMKNRILDINPDCQVETRQCFYLPENSKEFDFSEYDFVIDAIDNVTAKLDIIEKSTRLNINIISAMGTGNKLHPEMFEITDIYKTEMCPLAKVMRKELKNRGIKKLTVLYSKEKPVYKGDVPGSIGFTPPVAGLLMASYVVNTMLSK